MGVLRIDALPRHLSIPLVLTGKLGLDTVFYDIKGGGQSARGFSIGLRWAAQIALELDFINPRRARALDEEWGINHSTLYLELFGSTADSAMNVGNNFAWAIGLGLTF